MDGIVHTYKARLVAKGYTQTYGVDYEETFSPVANIRAIRILIAITAFYINEIWQMDVKTVFLNGYLNEDIYVVQHKGEATFILGIKIYQDRSKRLIRLSQSTYMDNILKIFRMDTSKRGYIPMQEKLDLNKTQGASTPEEVRLDCYCDAGFETNRDDIKSQTGYIFILNEGVVDWKSSKQSSVAMSIIEAEYIAASEATMEAGELTDLENPGNISLSYKKLSVKTKTNVIINDKLKVILKGKVHWIRVKELELWSPKFIEKDDDYSSSDEDFVGDECWKSLSKIT
ncbi:retrotransposon protein, putative, ty1-copia subclass [Tanacetum coccineum]